MFRYTADTAIILGAGFSKESGLPIARDLSASIFDPYFHGKLEEVITEAIRELLVDCFRWKEADPLPTFEDIFTMIDLAAGTGHSLGRAFTPKKLRAVRRMLIHRLFGILDRSFAPSPNIVKIVRTLVSKRNKTHFVVLNWDIVLEGYLAHYIPGSFIDYCVDISDWSGSSRSGNLRSESQKSMDPPTGFIAIIVAAFFMTRMVNLPSTFVQASRRLIFALLRKALLIVFSIPRLAYLRMLDVVESANVRLARISRRLVLGNLSGLKVLLVLG